MAEMADTVAMNGFGIGLTVALGIIIALGLRSPDLGTDETIMTIVFWSTMSGFLYELWHMALAPRDQSR